MLDKLYKENEKRMKEHVDGFRENLGMIRAGRANPSLVENITFDYYGTQTPIKQAATITVPEARLLVIQPWDKNALKEIERALIASDLGITPGNDGKLIRLPFPALTEDRRKELVKEVKKRSEQSKVGIRNIRREMMDFVKKAEKDGDITEDDKKSAESDIQEMTDKYTDKIDEIVKEKERELMEF